MAPQKSPAFQSYFMLDAGEFRMATAAMSLAAIGREFSSLCRAVSNRDRSIEARKPRYVGRIYWRRHKRPGISPKIREAVFKQSGYACVRCGLRDRLTVDHIVAWSKGGVHDISNFQTLCWPCNMRKGAR